MPQTEQNLGYLSQQLKAISERIFATRAARETWNIDVLIPEFNRLERICRALESIGVNLDEEDICALEGIAQGNELSDRNELRETINQAIGTWQEDQREREQEQALEDLAAGGFILNDDDGETWTKDDVRVVIELVNGSKCQYRWTYESAQDMDSGVSGDFARLLELIGAKQVVQ